MRQMLKVTVNGYPWEGLVKSDQSLLDFLRDELGLTGAKKGCDGGECGACVVLLDGRAVNSCLIPVLDVNNCEVRTIDREQSENGEQSESWVQSVDCLEVDLIIIALGVKPQPRLAVTPNSYQIFCIGDASKPGQIIDAVLDGFYVATQI